MTHLTFRLTAKNRDQLRNPTLGNRVWATFAFCNVVCRRGSGARWRRGRQSGVWLRRGTARTRWQFTVERASDCCAGRPTYADMAPTTSASTTSSLAASSSCHLTTNKTSKLKRTSVHWSDDSTRDVEYVGWSDVTESMVTTRSPFCGYNTT